MNNDETPSSVDVGSGGLLGVPPKFTGCDWDRFGHKNHGVTETLAGLGVGESATLPKRFWSCVGVIAQRLEIKIATRSLGSETEVTVYRIA